MLMGEGGTRPMLMDEGGTRPILLDADMMRQETHMVSLEVADGIQNRSRNPTAQFGGSYLFFLLSCKESNVLVYSKRK
jgi:hypothetical protein